MLVTSKNADASEMTGQIIDIFEDFLEKKNIHLSDSETEANIVGADYDTLKEQIRELLINWHIIIKP